MTLLPFAEVIGDPIAQSKSPIIHRYWLDAVGLVGDYRATRVAANDLRAFFAKRRGEPAWRGCNVTIPHKVAAIELLDRQDASMSAVGAVNTVVARDGKLWGYNTDVAGILDALPASLMPAGGTVCILGTGGAARAAFAACRARGVGLVLSLSRNPSGAEALIAELGLRGQAAGLYDVELMRSADVIINATPLGMTGSASMPQLLLNSLADTRAVVFDMVYAPLETQLLATARKAGLRAVDGLEMLIGQAALAFELLFDRPVSDDRDGGLRAKLAS